MNSNKARKSGQATKTDDMLNFDLISTFPYFLEVPTNYYSYTQHSCHICLHLRQIMNYCLRLRFVVKEFQRTLSKLKATEPTDLMINRFSFSLASDQSFSLLFLMRTNLFKRLIEKSRECHNHKPQPTPDTKRKRKMTKLNTIKTNKQTHEKHTDQLPLPQVRWSQC